MIPVAKQRIEHLTYLRHHDKQERICQNGILPSTTIHLRRRLVHLPRWIELSVAIRLQRNSTLEGRSALIFSVETAKQNKST
jgi:hypothetical protein